ncbi:DUF4124 domain-containing protein [Diaphorobacter caeni]|uniref:DUF4124 domain-containing protein n=1 Tax=Diaphorobacter caeni TaxID=2784387 RepID=UPI002B26F67C|nr:DUF4124 domain-containing protein [Diaphorobacter caeni]
MVAPVAAQNAVYSCVDKNGRRITADRPIPECIDREQRVLDKTGTERRRIGPTLTENERTQLDAQRRADAEQKAKVADQRRRERALITRYPDEATHNAERVTALAVFNDLIQIAYKRIEQLRSDRAAINTELEFYQNDPKKAPAKVQRRIADNEEDIAEQQRYIATQQDEKRKVQQRFDTELVQLKELWAAERAATGSVSAAKPASAAASR